MGLYRVICGLFPFFYHVIGVLWGCMGLCRVK